MLLLLYELLSISIDIAYLVTENLFPSGVAFLGLRLVYLSIILANKNKKEKNEPILKEMHADACFWFEYLYNEMKKRERILEAQQ